MLDADFESILKPVDELYREKMNEMTTERKDNPLYTEKINTNVPTGWCIRNKVAYEDAPDPLKMYYGKDL